jgi:peptidoglycan hydrolase CwlO-like protein
MTKPREAWVKTLDEEIDDRRALIEELQDEIEELEEQLEEEDDEAA